MSSPRSRSTDRGLSRLCECGCGEPIGHLRAGARYASGACRTRGWKARTGYQPQRARKASRNANRRRRPDLRISYLRAIDAVETLLTGYEPSLVLTPRERAEDVLRPLLGPKARRHA